MLYQINTVPNNAVSNNTVPNNTAPIINGNCNAVAISEGVNASCAPLLLLRVSINKSIM